MDPASLTALGMAGNIFQFVTLGCKLVSKARKIHKDGGLEEYVHLKVVVTDMAACSDNLRAGLVSQQQAQGPLAEDDAAMKEICSGCLEVAEEIQTALKRLNSHGPPTKWKSVRQALKSVWGKERLAELKDRLDMYNSQLETRILISLRTQIDLASLDERQQFTDLGGGVQAAIERIKELESRLAQQSRSLEENDANILAAVTNSASSNGEEHARTRSAVKETATTLQETSAVNHQETLRKVTSLGVQVTGAVKIAADANERQHEITMTEIELIRVATEQQVKELREEIRQLKIEIERSVQKVVASVGKVSASEQQGLKESSNAKFNVWVAKEIILKNLLEILKIFKSQIGDWVAAFESATWKMQPYPAFRPFRATTQSQPCPDIELDEAIEGRPRYIKGSPTEDLGNNVVNSEVLQGLRAHHYLPQYRKFYLESDLFFDQVFDACFDSCKYQSAQILLKAGVKPTYKSLLSALKTWHKDTVSSIGDAIFNSQKGSTESFPQQSCHLREGSNFPSNGGRFNQLVNHCDKSELGELVHLLNASPKLVNQKTEGVLSLTMAVQSGNSDVVDILILYGATPLCTDNIHNSPLLVAVDQWNLKMARTMIERQPSPLETGWEWHVLTALADKNFAARSNDIDFLIKKIGILRGLRLAIENRHERLMSFMLWRFKAESLDSGSAEVLEMAIQSGICREYAEYIKGYMAKKAPVDDPYKPVPVIPGSATRIKDSSKPVIPGSDTRVPVSPVPAQTVSWAAELEGLEFS